MPLLCDPACSPNRPDPGALLSAQVKFEPEDSSTRAHRLEAVEERSRTRSR